MQCDKSVRENIEQDSSSVEGDIGHSHPPLSTLLTLVDFPLAVYLNNESFDTDIDKDGRFSSTKDSSACYSLARGPVCHRIS